MHLERHLGLGALGALSTVLCSTLAVAQAEPPAVEPAPPPDAPSAIAAAPADAAAVPAEAPAPDAEADAAVAAALAGLSDDSADAAVVEAEGEFKLNIYGFADFTYTHVLNDFTFASPYPTFLVGSVNLYAGADLGDGWRSLIEFRLLYAPNGTIPFDQLFELEPTRTDTTVGDPADFGRPHRWGGVEIERAWIEYNAHPLLTIRGGQWLTPYGIWNVDHGSPVIIGVRRPYVVGEELIPERQTGIELYGSTFVGSTELGYNLGLSNGKGPIDAYQDLDKNKAVTVRLFAVNESPAGKLSVGFTGFRGRFTDRYTRIAILPTGDIGTEYVSRSSYDELSLSADLKWEYEDFSFQTEGMRRETAYSDRLPRAALLPVPGVPAGFQPDVVSYGFYALAAYRLPWYNIMPFFGGEVYNPGPTDFTGAAGAVWGGLNVRPTPRVVLKVQGTRSFFLDDPPLVGSLGLFAVDFQTAWSF
jgi:hypothetical protein